MKSGTTYQIKDVARLSGLTVRTLHHYDHIGLLVPCDRSEAGYRLYSDHDLLRLQQILIGRELGLSLKTIGRLLDDPGFELKEALTAQRAQLEERARKTARMIRAIDQTLQGLDNPQGAPIMNVTKNMFDGFDPDQYAEEAQERWGDTLPFVESQRRTSGYTPEDWKALKDEQARIYDDANVALCAGQKPDDPDVMDIAERHRLSIDRWFYPCSASMHIQLADMYEADPRFAANIDKHGAGLTPFLAAAIRANAAR